MEHDDDGSGPDRRWSLPEASRLLHSSRVHRLRELPDTPLLHGLEEKLKKSWLEMKREGEIERERK